MVVWRRLEERERFEVRYEGLESLLGYEVEENPKTVVIAVKRGTAFCGRPIYHQTYYFKDRRTSPGYALITHWEFHEEHTPMSPNTLGFTLWFPEVIGNAYRRTPVQVQEENLWWEMEDLRRTAERLGRGRS
ncbi:MAG: hypothetical protein QXI32_00850 [Candidatus Bathyarchaeia archaeon]